MISVAVIVSFLSLPACQRRSYRNPLLRDLTLYNREAELELSYRQREEVHEAFLGGGSENRFTEEIFEEKLSLRTLGYVYHPSLLEFSAATVLGLQQADFEDSASGPRGKSSSDGDIVEFDVSGRILQRKTYPATFHVRRGRSLQPRPFRSSIESLTTSYGGTWQYISDKTPVRLQYDVNEVELDPFIQGGELEGRRENTKLLLEAGYNFSEHNKLLFRYNRESIEEEPFTTQYDRNEMELTHAYEFGAEHEHRLDSRLLDYRQTGTFETERISWRERLSLRHSDRLQSLYQLEVTNRQQGSVSGSGSLDEQSHLLAAALDHRLYDNLSSHFNVYYQDQRFEAGPRIERIGWGANFQYYRHNPWGVLRVIYSVSTDLQDTSGGEQEFEVIEEGRTFVDPEPIILGDPNTLISSIMILREDRTEVYQQGSDYRVRQIANTVEIERVVTGRIQDRETVLVSYRFRIEGAFELDTLNQFLEIRQEFDFGLTPYYEFRRQEQTLRPATSSSVIPEDITVCVIGADFTHGSLQLNAEYEDYDSSVSPFMGYRLSADYSRRFGNGGRGNVGARWSSLEFQGQQYRKTRLFTAMGGYKHPITPRMTVEGLVSYRTQEDSVSGDDEGIELDLALEWLIRSTRIRLDYRFATFEDNLVQRDSSMLFVEIKRRL